MRFIFFSTIFALLLQASAGSSGIFERLENFKKLEKFQAFVRGKQLRQKLQPIVKGKTVFYLNAAPDSETYTQLQEQHLSDPENFVVFISMSFKDFRNFNNREVTATKLHDHSANVYKAPSNARCPYKKNKKQNFDVFIDKIELNATSWPKCQAKIVEETIRILDYLEIHHIKTYFGSIARLKRPTYVSGKGDSLKYIESKRNRETGAVTTNPLHERMEDTSKAFMENYFVHPLFWGERNAAKYIGMNTGYEASYLADPSTVVSSMLPDIPFFWEKVNFDANIGFGTHQAPFGGRDDPPAINVPYIFLNEKAPEVGSNFFTITEGGETAVQKLYKHFTAGYYANIAKKAFVVHDALLNDIDDVVANQMIEEISLEPAVFHKTYEARLTGRSSWSPGVSTHVVPGNPTFAVPDYA